MPTLMKKPTLVLISGLLFLFLISLSLQAEQPEGKPKNIILMIGDGMGFNQHIAGAYWRCGQLGKQSYEQFPFHCGVTTFCARSTASVPPCYPGYEPEVFWIGLEGANLPTELTQTTDSTAAATAIYTGSKTLIDRLNIDPSGNRLETAGTVAHRQGKSIGVVTTVQTYDATPGCMAAHNIDRYHEEEILREMVYDSGLQVIIGSGHPERGRETAKFDGEKIEQREKFDYGDVGGEKLWGEMLAGEANGFMLVETTEDFQRVADAKVNVPQKIIGFPNVAQPIAPVDGMPDGDDSEEVKKVAGDVLGNQSPEKIPTLSLMSLTALNVLNQNENGFFVMIEGGAIDWACHARSPERVVMEQTAFAKAVDAVCGWVEQNSSWDETVLIVTSDHETSQLWGEGTYRDKNKDNKFETLNDVFLGFQPVQNNGKGKIPGMQFGFTNHTNSLVPLWAKGPNVRKFEKYYRGADEKAGKFWNFSGNYIDNTDIARFIINDCL